MRLALVGCALAGLVGCGGGDPAPKDQGSLNTIQQKEQAEVDDAEKAMQAESKPKPGKKR
jgi:hypothetical protein